jgi:UDPglucose--hexose-1-phosphate uridylyltransferase
MSELRRDPITGRTVIIAPERVASIAAWKLDQSSGANGESCPFCERRESLAGPEILAWRPPGQPANGPGWRVRVVANRLPALRVESQYSEPATGLLQTLGGLGAHEVIIDSPDHRSNWSTMSVEELRLVLWAWRERIRDLRRDIRLQTFLIVKNVGASAGATLEHAHSQLLALPFVPLHLGDELAGARVRHEQSGRCVFCAVVGEELAKGVRVVSQSDDMVAFCPFASRVPFETWILPRRHEASFDEQSDEALVAVATCLRDSIQRLQAALTAPPYSVLLHTAPVGETSAYHWHLEIVPRLTAVDGLAWDGGIHINPVAPEEAARILRDALG